MTSTKSFLYFTKPSRGSGRAKIRSATTWIGAGEDQICYDYETIKDFFLRTYAEKAVPDCIITDEDYRLVSWDEHSCLVAGRCWIATKPETGYVLRAHQRVTFSYKLVDGELKITLIHISNPVSYTHLPLLQSLWRGMRWYKRNSVVSGCLFFGDGTCQTGENKTPGKTPRRFAYMERPIPEPVQSPSVERFSVPSACSKSVPDRSS